MVAPRTYLTADEIDAIAESHFLPKKSLAAVADAAKDARLSLAQESLVRVFEITNRTFRACRSLGVTDQFMTERSPEWLFTYKAIGDLVLTRMVADGRFHADGTLRLWRKGELSYEVNVERDVFDDIVRGRRAAGAGARLTSVLWDLTNVVIAERHGDGVVQERFSRLSPEDEQRREGVYAQLMAQMFLDDRMSVYCVLRPWPDGEDAYAERIRDLAARGELAEPGDIAAALE